MIRGHRAENSIYIYMPLGEALHWEVWIILTSSRVHASLDSDISDWLVIRL